MRIYTIGHSNHTWESFAPLLKRHGVRALVDVRSNPVSRWAPFANKRRLPGLLEPEGIAYVYMGDSLGGKPADPSRYDSDGRSDYDEMRLDASFRKSLDALLPLAEETTVVLMCAEENPARCHRRLLLGPALEARGALLRHIRKDGLAEGGAG